MRPWQRLSVGLVGLYLFSWTVLASEPDLSQYRSPDKAISAKVGQADVAPLRTPAFLGVQVGLDGNGWLEVQHVAADSPADKAGVRRGDQLLLADSQGLKDDVALAELLDRKSPGETLPLVLSRQGKRVDLTARLTPLSRPKLLSNQQTERKGKGGNFDFRNKYWDKNKAVYRLGIILVEYPDEKHNAKIPPKAWEDSMFSKGTYSTKNVTGQTVYGSMNDHYLEQSYGKLSIEGKAFDYVKVSKKRGEYATGKRDALLVEAMDLIVARDGKDAFKGLDGVFFVYAGKRYNSPRGSLYWPHRANVRHQGKSWPYFICQEGGETMNNISVFCHEFGHMLGLPDLYARPENPGMEGVGVWCLMANQINNGRPQHMCAWSKEKLGWIQPAVIDPTVKQKLILAPINDSPKECFKVLVRRDGSEYLLLENRAKKGFDKGLPAGGLLVWRVVGNRPVLEESHGVQGPSGPNVFQDAVPFPSAANDAFTPYTIPSSQSKLGGGLPVHITNIRRLPDGRITFHIGYEYQ